MRLVKLSRIEGSLEAPPSKSYMQRAVAAAFLSAKRCEIINPSYSDDGRAALRVVSTLGSELEEQQQRVIIRPGKRIRDSVLDCGESGTSLRMFSAIAATDLVMRWTGKVVLEAKGSLSLRPVSMIQEALTNLGVTCQTQGGFPPVIIRGALKPGKVTVDGSLTSQFISGLLMALPLCKGDSELYVKNLKSRPYLAMTLDLLKQFGISVENREFKRFMIPGNQEYQNRSYTVEGDWSAAAFLLVAGAVAGRVEVRGLRQDSLQADRAVTAALIEAGATLEWRENSVVVSAGELKGFSFDASHCPDLFPPLVALAAFCKGPSKIRGVERLAHKESNRGEALAREFGKMGVEIALFPHHLEVKGIEERAAGAEAPVIDSHNDHRIAMAAAVAGLGLESGLQIEGENCVSKSYPGFFEDLKTLGGKLEGPVLDSAGKQRI